MEALGGQLAELSAVAVGVQHGSVCALCRPPSNHPRYQPWTPSFLPPAAAASASASVPPH